jgi:SAM-dependent methyltransferase
LVFSLKRHGPARQRERNLRLAACYLERCEHLEYRERNQRGWAELARRDHPYCRPFGEEHLARARELLDPRGWIDWGRHRRVLLLGGGGGQHSLLLASLGLDVVVIDLCPEQLERDREACACHGHRVATIEADMADLQDIDLVPCDLIYHAMSSQFVPDLRPVYRGIVRHLTGEGVYVGHHRNPLLGQVGRGNEGNYAIVRPHGARHPWERGHLWAFADGDQDLGTVQFVHSLTDLLGTACEEGLLIDAFWEKTCSRDGAGPGTREHLYQAIPSAVWFRARRARPSHDRRCDHKEGRP